jgi:hypothetical protein
MAGKTYAVRPDQMTRDEAQDITRAIRTRCEEIWDLLVIAYNRRADVAMGYDSWDDYCTVEFREARIQVPAEERSAVVGSMRAAGMSTRAIGAAMGTSATTVRRDIEAGAPDGAAETRLVTRAAGSGSYTVAEPVRPPTAAEAAPTTSDGAPIVTAHVIGLDGRRHPARHYRCADPGVTGGNRDRLATTQRSQPYNVGGRSAASPGWGMLASALQVFVDDPAPVTELSKQQRASIARNLARIKEMMG